MTIDLKNLSETREIKGEPAKFLAVWFTESIQDWFISYYIKESPNMSMLLSEYIALPKWKEVA